MVCCILELLFWNMGRNSMAYSLDLRQKVIRFIENKGSRNQAVHCFGIGLSTLKRWLKRPDLRPKKTGPRNAHKLNLIELQKNLDATPEATLAELSQPFGVSQQAIFYALKKQQITRKKNDTVSRKRSPKKASLQTDTQEC